MNYKQITVTLCSIFALISCSSRDDDGGGANGCTTFGNGEYTLKIQDVATELPAKVSVFFKVTDEDGNGVAGLNAGNFDIYERGRNDDCFNSISSAESSAEISNNAQTFRNTTFLVLDLSNSVLSTSLNELKQASLGFIDGVMPDTPNASFNMGIYWFDGGEELNLLQPITSSKTALEAAINGSTSDISNDASTNLYGAIVKVTDLAKAELSNLQSQEIFAAASVVVFTDGRDQAASFTENQAQNAIDNAPEAISYYTIGLGSEIDEDVLEDFGTTASAFAQDATQLETVFNEVSQNVAGQANSFYLFEYCSPKRDGSGDSRLLIEVISGENKGNAQTTFNAAGFAGGCQ